MIPESAGATPLGIFLLADEYREAAEHSAKNGKGRTNGPARLLAYHACELFLKTHLRSHGKTVDALRDYGHDLSAMLDAARKCGLSPSETITNHIAVATRRKDYVRVRYLVVDGKFGLRLEKVLNLATALRECVRLALDFNEFGMPNGDSWAGPEPADYIEAGSRTNLQSNRKRSSAIPAHRRDIDATVRAMARRHVPCSKLSDLSHASSS